MRDYQLGFNEAVTSGWSECNRQLGVMATGLGKTVCFAKLAQKEVEAGGRVLVIAHTDELLEQAIAKILAVTELQASKEKADEIASPSASIVVASIQSLARESRLRGFDDRHFSLVIVDEAHRILAASYLRVVRYFHFGAESLEDGWKQPEPGEPYKCNARVLGVTATADRGDKRNLGEIFEKVAFEYGLLEGCRDGYLVRPIVQNVPLKIDLKGVRRTAGDYNAEDVEARLIPVLSGAAAALKQYASQDKTVVFTPTVESARLMAEACCAVGLSAGFVSGRCHDRDEKIVAFDHGGPGSVICCAILLTEGWDSPTASAVCVLRPTKIRSLMVQCVGRVLRPLTGVIDGLDDRVERLNAIAASPKKRALLLDFLWLTDKLDLIRPVDLVTLKPEIKKAMEESGSTDLVAAEEKAERDLLASLEAAARKHAKKSARTIDPIAFAVTVGDAAIASYVPETAWECAAPHSGQVELLTKNGIDVSQIKSRGLASKILDRIVQRVRLGLCTPKQMTFLTRLGMSEEQAALTTLRQARAIIGKKLAERQRARA